MFYGWNWGAPGGHFREHERRAEGAEQGRNALSNLALCRPEFRARELRDRYFSYVPWPLWQYVTHTDTLV